jgi:DNA-binding NarL/FixJ family response regulator
MMLILDDHPLVREGLSAIIRMYRPEETIFQAGTGKEALCLLDREEENLSEGDIAFVDINLGQESGFAFLEELQKRGSPIRRVAITSSSREADFLYAQKLGVNAYVLKDAFIDEIMYGLHVVERGGKFYSPALVEKMNAHTGDMQCLHELTDREMEVLVLMGQGYSNAQISGTLFISQGTAKKHITSILSKLELKSRVEVVLFVSQNSLFLQGSARQLGKRQVKKA